MTLEEKILIGNVMMGWTWGDYKGSKRLTNEWDKVYKSIKAEYYEIIGLSPTKSQMVFINKVYPFFVEYWKTEKDHIINYLDRMTDNRKDKFCKIMDKYHD